MNVEMIGTKNIYNRMFSKVLCLLFITRLNGAMVAEW